MSYPLIFGLIALTFLWYNFYTSISIVKYLKSNGKEASLFTKGFYVKGKIFKYLPLYKETTVQKEGKVGHLYVHFFFTFFMFLVFLLLGIISVSR